MPILLYHSVGSEAEPLDAPFTLTPGLFREHLDLLRSYGAHTLTVSEFVEHIRMGRSLPERTILITIDDAYANTVDAVLPILLEFGMTATVYVTTGYVDRVIRGMRMISWRGVRTLHECGFEVGAHSVTHPELDTVQSKQAVDEVRLPKQRLEDELAAPVHSYAYPHGYYTRGLQRLVATSAYTSAAAVRNEVSHPGDDIYALSRLHDAQHDHGQRAARHGHRGSRATGAAGPQRAHPRVARLPGHPPPAGRAESVGLDR